MRKVLLSVIIILNAVILSAQVCNPSWSGTDSGIQPDTVVNLPHGFVNQPYDAVVNFKVPTVDSSFGVPLYISHVTLTGITGLSGIPNSVPFVYNCNPPSCDFEADSVGCVRIQGTATSPGTYTLVINTVVYLTSGTGLPINQAGYKIVIENGSGIEGLSETQFDVSQNNPNPAKTFTTVFVNLENAAGIELKISNVLGTEVMKKNFIGAQGVNKLPLDVSTLPQGMYFYSVSDGKHQITRRMVIDKK